MKPETLIHTTKGLVPLASLQVQDIVTGTETTREIATEWRMGSELVRRDVWVSVLRGEPMGSEQGRM
jgi:hypothetical protein